MPEGDPATGPVPNGLLSVEVNAPTIVAGQPSTVSLVIRNPFPEQVEIDLIQAPSAAPLLPERVGQRSAKTSKHNDGGFLQRWGLGSLIIRELRFGPLVAEFPEPEQNVRIDLGKGSKLLINKPMVSSGSTHITAAEGSTIEYNVPDGDESALEGKSEDRTSRTIPPYQEDLASFEITTAHWLFVKPKTLELHALIRYRVGDRNRSQVVPVVLAVQPPVKSIVLGSVIGSVLGYAGKQLNSGTVLNDLLSSSNAINLLGVVVLGAILAIVLSRQESSKGFVTLEDFYGAFVAGAVLGYLGSDYFETIVNPTATLGGGTAPGN